ncbi:uncharacterized protein [Clytia hemisphaerica]|uniref:EGF-like domain-containing protein n=1 Tax=Clytia hemisphaerica TaxID=252671 RepID=A0A7M5V290_9CNID
MFKLVVLAVLFASQCLLVEASCGCQNNGQCGADFTCTCPDGFYGPICNQYAETYTIRYESTPSGIRTSDITNGFKLKLLSQKITKSFSVGLGNLYAVTFYQALTEAERRKLQSVASDVAAGTTVAEISDFNECVDGKQSCYNGLKCINTQYSFRCGCPEGYEVKENRCIQEVDSNAKTVIYVWAGAVGAVILFTLGCLMFYRHRKIEKGKKSAFEYQKKMANRGQLTPTNLSEYEGQHGRRGSPSASVVDGHTRYSMGDIGSDVYSYNANYNQDPSAYYGTQTRLSIPMDNSQVNPGYEPTPEHLRFPSTGSYTNNGAMGTYGQPETDNVYNPHAQMGNSPNTQDNANTFTNTTTNPTATDEVPLH